MSGLSSRRTLQLNCQIFFHLSYSNFTINCVGTAHLRGRLFSTLRSINEANLISEHVLYNYGLVVMLTYLTKQFLSAGCKVYNIACRVQF